MLAMNKRKFFLLLSLIGGFLLFAQSGFSEDQSAGFYAGPLSVAATAVEKKAKPLNKVRKPQNKTEIPQKDQENLPEKTVGRFKESDTDNPIRSLS